MKLSDINKDSIRERIEAAGFDPDYDVIGIRVQIEPFELGEIERLSHNRDFSNILSRPIC